MNWLSILGIAVILVVIVSVFGLNPKGGRPVIRTRLMFMARIFLIILGLLMLYLGFKLW
jgi:predicted Na+-dependent transporter